MGKTWPSLHLNINVHLITTTWPNVPNSLQKDPQVDSNFLWKLETWQTVFITLTFLKSFAQHSPKHVHWIYRQRWPSWEYHIFIHLGQQIRLTRQAKRVMKTSENQGLGANFIVYVGSDGGECGKHTIDSETLYGSVPSVKLCQYEDESPDLAAPMVLVTLSFSCLVCFTHGYHTPPGFLWHHAVSLPVREVSWFYLSSKLDPQMLLLRQGHISVHGTGTLVVGW